MAALVRSFCADGCGSVEVSSRQVTLAVWPEQVGSSTYSFRCPACGRIQVWGADPLTQSKLTMAGAMVRNLKLPERTSLANVSPITSDDLIDLMLESEGLDTLTELLEERDGTTEEG